MADLNQGTRQRNLRHVCGSAAVPSGNTRSVSVANVVGGGGPPAPSTDWIQALGGRIGGWCIENGKLTADGGNVKLNSFVPSVSLGSATDYITGTGFWVGKNSAVYKLHLGDPEGNHLKWDGSTLTVVGTISATAGAIGGWTIGANSISADAGAAVIDSSVPKITLGLASNFMVGAGFFVGKSDGAYKFRIGDPEGNYVKWDGATGALTLNGTVTTNSLNPALQSFTTSIVFSSTDNDTVSWTTGTIRLASGVTYSITAGNTGNMTALTYIYLDTAVSTTALQTTTSYSNAVGDNRLLMAAAQNHASGASAITYTGQQPIVNATDQITAQSIVAGNIAAGAVTADKISVTTLAAIQANIGAATINDVLTIGASGGIYQGTGTFAGPTTGLKVWNDGGVGRLATYSGGTPQVYFDTEGKLLAGGGAVTLDANGLTLAQGTGAANKVLWKSGVDDAGYVATYLSGSEMYGTLSVLGAPSASDRAHLRIAAVDGQNGTYTAKIDCWSGPSPFFDVYGNMYIYAAASAGGNLGVAGTLTVGGLAVRPSGDARFSAWVNADVLNVTGDGTGYGVVYNAEVYDDGADFNTSTGVFTAPVTGRYHFSAAVSLKGIDTAAHSFAFVEIVTTGKLYRCQRVHASNGYDGGGLGLVAACDAAMTAGDTAYVRVYVFGGTKIVDIEGNASAGVTHFSGHLIA